MSLVSCLMVMIGGALGSLARYAAALAMAPLSDKLPVGTIVINATGSLLIGFFGSLTLDHGRHPVPEMARIFVMIGFCGGFTTFSAFSLQTFDLLRSGAVLRALFNVVASTVLCVLAVYVGHLIATSLNGGAVAVAQIAAEDEA